MEDILASIRKMIAQDQDDMDATRADRREMTLAAEATSDDEVLDLVDALPEDGVMVHDGGTPPPLSTAWDELPEERGAVIEEDTGAESIDVETAFAIREGAPAAVDTAADTGVSETSTWRVAEGGPIHQEPITVGLSIQDEPHRSDADTGDTAHRGAEPEPSVVSATANVAASGAPDPITTTPVAAEPAEAPRKEAADMETLKDRILSPEAAVKTSAAFDQLAKTLVSGYDGDSNTLEGLVRGMLKPLLKEWLDANLPRIVEDIVQAEIRRLSR